MLIESKTIGEAWLKCTKSVIENGDWFYDENYSIKELLNLSLVIEKPSTSDKIITQHGDLVVVNRMLRKFKEIEIIENRPFSYGQRIYSYNGINQISWAVNRLKNKKETKSASISLLIPGDSSSHLPCLTTIDFKIRFDRLYISSFFRSQNIFGRQYANLLALSNLQHEVAKKCKTKIGKLSCFISSAHIYKYDEEMAKSLIAGKISRIKDDYYIKGPGK